MKPIQKVQRKTPFAKKGFGQNFLVDANYVDRIIRALAPRKDETIVEIGAGRGALTEKLVRAGARVVAIELEREMIRVLKEKFAGAENFRLIESDALKVDFAEITGNSESQISTPKSKLVANLPYYISTAILQKLIERRAAFAEMILMFQREVVERITAPVGSAERGFLTVLIENYLNAEKLFDVPPTAFRPAPKVTSAVVRLTPKNDAPVDDDENFRELVSRAFRQKRKTIVNNLKNDYENAFEVLEKCGIEANRRAESLGLEEWRRLSRALIERE